MREAYHGEPYATRFLCREAFESPTGEAAIPAALLRDRLAETLVLVDERARGVYGEMYDREIRRMQQSFIDFVELCEGRESETGEPVTIVASY